MNRIHLSRCAAFLLLLATLALSGCSTPSERSASSGSVRARQMIVPKGRVGRHKEFRLRASYITIHSTGNRGATALQHARGMAAGSFRGQPRHCHSQEIDNAQPKGAKNVIHGA